MDFITNYLKYTIESCLKRVFYSQFQQLSILKLAKNSFYLKNRGGFHRCKTH